MTEKLINNEKKLLPPESHPIHVFSFSNPPRQQGVTLVYVFTSTGSTVLCICSVAVLYFCQMPEHDTAIQQNSAQSRQEVTLQQQQHNIHLIFLIKHFF